MKALMHWTGGLLGLLVAASVSWGQYWVTPVARTPIPHAPDARGGGYYFYVPGYNANAHGTWFGPNYCLYPPFEPFQGIRPPMINLSQGGAGAGPAGPAAFPSHPFVRSPRDFFMFNENLEDTLNPDLRPGFVR